MKIQLFLISIFSLTLIGCDRDRHPMDSTRDATNAGRNAQDQSGMTKTAEDQSETEADRAITQKIRQAIMADNQLSTNAKNIKIITIQGIVTLRGPVDNAREKEELNRKAQRTPGVRQIENQIEVSKNG